jgi:tetratricopeptide (TPR) repeat protein
MGNSLNDKNTKESYAAAEQIFRRMIEVQRGHPEIAAPMGSTSAPYIGLSAALWNQGRAAEAEPYAREALRLDLADGWRGTRSHAMLLRDLGGILRDQGKLPEAAEAFREGVALEKELGHRLATIELTAEDYLDVLVRLKEFGEAVKYAESRVRLAEADDPPNSELLARRNARLDELRHLAVQHANDSTTEQAK